MRHLSEAFERAMLKAQPPSDENWELVSDVESVVSFCTIVDTYADIAKLPAVDKSTPKTRPSAPAITSKPPSTKNAKLKPEDQGSSQFDAYFLMEGVKGARGGKASLMFKGNLKTQKPRKKERRTYNRARSRVHIY